MILFEAIYHDKLRDHFMVLFYWYDSVANIIHHLPWAQVITEKNKIIELSLLEITLFEIKG